MKKVIKFLPVAAIILGGTMALATTTKMEEPNVYKHPDTGVWTDISDYPPGSYDCLNQGECTAYRDKDGNFSKIRPGVFTPKDDN